MRKNRVARLPKSVIALAMLAAFGAVWCWGLAQGTVTIPAPIVPPSEGIPAPSAAGEMVTQMPATVAQSVVDTRWLLAAALLAAVAVVTATNALLTWGYSRRE